MGKHVIIVVQENRSPDNLFQDPVLLSNSAVDILNANPIPPNPNAACNNIGSGGTGLLSLLPANFAACFDPQHGHHAGFEGAYDSGNGTFDNACTVQATHDSCFHSGADTDNYTYAYNAPITGTSCPCILDPYYQIGENYSFSDYMFQSNRGRSFLAHQFLFSGTSAPIGYGTGSDPHCTLFAAENPTESVGFPQQAGCFSDSTVVAYDLDSNSTSPPTEGYTYSPAPGYPGYPCYSHTSMADLLDNASPSPISLAYYTQSSSYLGGIWTAPNALTGICSFTPDAGFCTPPTGSKDDWQYVESEPGQILSDLANCNLPSVSWVIPDGYWSDHPGWKNSTTPSNADGGPSWVAAIVNAVGATKPCPYGPGLASFSNTVILVTWDDWGGWFDHVAPYLSPLAQEGHQGGYPNPPPLTAASDGRWYAYGFRVPLLVISPYTSGGYVSGNKANGPVQPYVHDFGSILGFVEATFNLPPYQSGSANTCGIAGAVADPTEGCNFPFADYFAPDGPFECQKTGGCGSYGAYPLSDFFNLPTPRTFTAITNAKYPPSCFQEPDVTDSNCFPNYPSEPDNDDVDPQD